MEKVRLDNDGVAWWVFEIPTGVAADGWGRRVSFLLGTVTLAGSTYLGRSFGTHMDQLMWPLAELVQQLKKRSPGSPTESTLLQHRWRPARFRRRRTDPSPAGKASAFPGFLP